jgi:hypothetical protein
MRILVGHTGLIGTTLTETIEFILSLAHSFSELSKSIFEDFVFTVIKNKS